MKRGRERNARAASTAGLNRSVCPTASITPRAAARAIRSSACASVVVIGFSTSTWMPASSSIAARAWCASVGEAMVTASTMPISAEASVRCACAPCCAAISAARDAFTSTTAASTAPGVSPRIRA